MSKYLPIIGLEIHVQLKTKTKMFCGCSAAIWQAKPNTHVCPVCLGLPGALPVMNKFAIDYVVKTGLALNCTINRHTYFERKNYFYPDLPKGYQISQHRQPLCADGKIRIEGEEIRIHDVHLEEDTGKSIHVNDPITGEGHSLLDFNKSGIPLMEIVSAPDIHSSDQAVKFCKLMQHIVRYLNISDADIEKGQMRFEVNVSVGQLNSKSVNQLPNYRVEIKNLSSFKFVRKAIDYEIKRQSELLKRNVRLVQETRGFDENKGITVSQREKEQAHDYRYFPEPDLPPLEIPEEEIEKLRSQIPELPHQAVARLVREGLRLQDAETIIQDQNFLNYLDQSVNIGIPLTFAATIIVNRPDLVKRYTPEELKTYFEKQKAEQIGDENTLKDVAKKVIKDNPNPVTDYKSGKTNALQFLVGQIMRETKGKAEPRSAAKTLRQLLE